MVNKRLNDTSFYPYFSTFYRAASSYDNVANLQHHFIEHLVDCIHPMVPKDATIADIGSGTGTLGKLAKKRAFSWQVTGIDIAPAMCKIAAPYQYKTIRGDMHHIPLGNGGFDASVSAFTIQWSDQPALAITELTRITRPGGTVAILTFLDGTLAELSEACQSAGTADKTNHFYKEEDYETWCAKAGLALVEKNITHETTTYPNVDALFQSLKDMGATNSNPDSMKGLGNRGELDRVREAYTEQFGDESGIPASWNVGMWVYKK